MVGGFNTNVRYLGRTFHVQTEDSGPNTAKIVTLLYEGGSILFSRKTSYQTNQSGNLTAAVRELMECQHKEMVEALKSGGLDAEIGADSTADQIVEIVSEEPPTPATPTARAARVQPAVAQPRATKSARAPQPRVAAPADAPLAAPSPQPASFGAGVLTDRPLDQVVLDHFAVE